MRSGLERGLRQQDSLHPGSWDPFCGFAGLLARAACPAGGDITQPKSKVNTHVYEREKQRLEQLQVRYPECSYVQDCLAGLEGKTEDFEETWKIRKRQSMGLLQLECLLRRWNKFGTGETTWWLLMGEENPLRPVSSDHTLLRLKVYSRALNSQRQPAVPGTERPPAPDFQEMPLAFGIATRWIAGQLASCSGTSAFLTAWLWT